MIKGSTKNVQQIERKLTLIVTGKDAASLAYAIESFVRAQLSGEHCLLVRNRQRKYQIVALLSELPRPIEERLRNLEMGLNHLDTVVGDEDD